LVSGASYTLGIVRNIMYGQKAEKHRLLPTAREISSSNTESHS